jgi:hypothetical protein
LPRALRSLRVPFVALVAGVALASSAGCSGKNDSAGARDDATGGANPSGGSTSAGGADASGGTAASGGSGNAPTTGGRGGSSTGGDAGTSAGGETTGGAGGTGAGDAGSPSGGLAGSFAGAGGASGGSAGTASVGGETSSLSVPSDSLSTGVRFHTGTVPTNRTNGPAQGPTQTVRIRNQGLASASVGVTLSGPDAARFELLSPSFPAVIPPSSDLDVTVRIVTASTALGAAPAQDDGATVLRATLSVTGSVPQPTGRLYALVLTYGELEPTFGQILDAFPHYTSNLPSSIRNDANPNPPTLPGVEAGTDEVRAPKFRRANETAPVTLRPLARFSPPGLVPFGFYAPSALAARTTVGTLAQATDPHTNDKSRMLLPPLASGTTEFAPNAAEFGLWMAPAGVGLLATDDADGFDGAHRVKVWTLRDASGAVRPNEYLVGGEEAANGDYQDYVFVVTNVLPVP